MRLGVRRVSLRAHGSVVVLKISMNCFVAMRSCVLSMMSLRACSTFGTRPLSSLRFTFKQKAPFAAHSLSHAAGSPRPFRCDPETCEGSATCAWVVNSEGSPGRNDLSREKRCEGELREEVGLGL